MTRSCTTTTTTTTQRHRRGCRSARLAGILGAIAGLQAAPALARSDPHWQFTSLQRLLADSKDPLRRESAALALGRRGATGAVPLLIRQLVKDSNPWVRARCGEALGMIGDARAIKPLLSALAREKRQRVRRHMAEALMRLGRREGLLELMWQLRSGTNHSKAQAMKMLVSTTGMPLGQDTKAWWSYFAAGGYEWLDRRSHGAPTIFELGRSATLFVPGGAASWRVVPTVVLRLKPRQSPITERTLRGYERWYGPIPDGCLLMIETRWQQAPRRRNDLKKAATSSGATRRAVGPGLALDAVQYLLARAPGLLGIGTDAPTLDLPAVRTAHPARSLLLNKGRIVIEGVDGLDRLTSTGSRVLLLQGKQRTHLVALLP